MMINRRHAILKDGPYLQRNPREMSLKWGERQRSSLRGLMKELIERGKGNTLRKQGNWKPMPDDMPSGGGGLKAFFITV